MPGFSETLTLDQLADRVASSGARVSLRPEIPVIRQLIISATKENFAGSHAPDGTPWKPLSPRSRQRKRDRRGQALGGTPQPLRDTGILMASVTGKGRGNYETLTDSRFEYGTAIDYAAYHQEGTRTIPARPFLGIGDRLAEQLTEVVAEGVARQIAEGI